MFNPGLHGDRRSNRALIASGDAEERRHVTTLAKAAGLRSVGFVSEADQVLSRTSLSRPDVLLLQVDMLRTLREKGVPTAALSNGPVNTVIVGKRFSRTLMTQLRTEGFMRLLVLGEDGMRPPDLLGRDLEHLVGDFRSSPVAETCPAPSPSPAPKKRKVLTPASVVVGSSTGGPVALMAFCKALPPDFPLPVAVVQHMPPGFTAMLSERLNAECSLRVVEAGEGMPFEAGTVYIAPGGSHMLLKGSRTACQVGLDLSPPENSCRPAVDVLFRSSANVYGGHQHAIVLTGMGRDGLAGAALLHDLGSRIVVQDAVTSTVWGMPGAIAQAGLADDILPLDAIAPHLLRCL